MRFTAWSYSRWQDYELCPLKARLKHLDKLKEPQGPAAARGQSIDEITTAYLQAPGSPALPPELAQFPLEFADLRAKRRELILQQRWAFDRDWRPVEYFAPTAWVRVVLDVGWAGASEFGQVGEVIDVKTGRVYPEHANQLQLYAPAMFAHAKHALGRELTVVNAALWYLDQGLIDDRGGRGFTADEGDKLVKVWDQRVKRMLTDEAFPPRPNEKCKWCHYRRGNGGPCPV